MERRYWDHRAEKIRAGFSDLNQQLDRFSSLYWSMQGDGQGGRATWRAQ